MNRRYQSLNLNNFEKNSVNKIWLEIIRDSMHRSIAIPITIVKGIHAGPTFGMTAALHGDEINGIGVLHKFLEKINPKDLTGTLVCVHVANAPGYELKTRSFSDKTDLNHIMPGKRNGNTAEVYAYHFFTKVIKKFDYLVDLHTASKGRQNTLYIRADMNDKNISKMAKLLAPEIILHNPPNDKTLRGAASKAGIPSLTVEIGNPSRFQVKYIKRTVMGLKALLANAGILNSAITPMKVDNPVNCKSSKWIYTDSGGILEVKVDLGQFIVKGELIATIKDIFGDIIIEYRSPSSGIVIGKSIDPVAETGARIIHLGSVDGK